MTEEEFSILSKATVVLFFISILINVGVRCQENTNGFINIDCGYEGEDYKDTDTDLIYKSDASFVDRGVAHKLSNPPSSAPKQLATLRSFPDDSRICYALRDLVRDAKYLIRSRFMYGNYDGLNSTDIEFDLYLGVNLCEKIYISSSSTYTFSEVVTVAVSDVLTVCLAGQTGTLFLSSLELRPLETAMYPPLNVSNTRALVLNSRQNMGASDDLRYPDDSYDRIWEAIDYANWSAISTDIRVSDGSPQDEFRGPSAVLQTAVVPAGNGTHLDLVWDADTYYYGNFSQYYVVMYLAEISSNETKRSFNIFLMNDSHPAYKQVTPQYLLANEIYSPFLPSKDKFHLSLRQDKTSMYPPILNALEIYVLTIPTELPTDVTDVAAIMKIKEHYQLKKNWMGDPCAPKLYFWRGLNCNYTYVDSSPTAPRIIAINLSSSGLTGYLADSFLDLTAITNLDLSENNLNGTIPEFLADITSLKVLNLSGNNFIGSVPSALLSRSAKHTLTLRVDGNPSLCTDEALCPVAKKNTGNKKVVLSAIIAILLVMLLLFLLLCICKMRRKQRATYAKHKDVSPRRNAPFQGESLQFTYLELQKITNDFEFELGKGGFGSVYHGRLESGSEVAVKMRSQASAQGTKEFMAEVELLMRIHHRNLVSLVGYCNDGKYLALIYEYMSEGNLAEHLRGKTQNSRGLCWEERLQIALEAAEGLDYLHKGCDPPIVHRDVKTSNILLHKNRLTKIADFGLSKVFHNSDFTHVSTAVAGTPGYLDPEYYSTYQLTRKSDVYSFGVVLLELVTGQSPIIQGPDKCIISIVQWIRPWLAQGDLGNLVDPTLEVKGYGVDAVWKAIDIALNCTAATSVQRPDMASVVAQLKEALALETTVKEAPAGFTMEMRNMSESRVSEISLIGGPSAR